MSQRGGRCRVSAGGAVSCGRAILAGVSLALLLALGAWTARPSYATLRGVVIAHPGGVVLRADVFVPAAVEGPRPAVVLVHGSGGVNAKVDRWSQELNGIGVATFILDSFSARGIVETATNQAQLEGLTMINDAYRALEVLAKHWRIDPARIALMGFSRGGRVALYASLKRFQRLHGPADVEFAA